MTCKKIIISEKAVKKLGVIIIEMAGAFNINNMDILIQITADRHIDTIRAVTADTIARRNNLKESSAPAPFNSL